MLRTMSSLLVPNFDSTPSSVPKLKLIFHFPQVNPLALDLNYLSIRESKKELSTSLFNF